MEGSRQVLVKVMLFQLRKHPHPQDCATPSFSHESSSPLLVLSIDVSFVSKFFWKGDDNFKKSNKWANIYGGPCSREGREPAKCYHLLLRGELTSNLFQFQMNAK